MQASSCFPLAKGWETGRQSEPAFMAPWKRPVKGIDD